MARPRPIFFLVDNLFFYFFRFVILKLVPRDHVDQLPVPKRIMDYLKTPNYYSENIEDHPEKEEEQNENQIVTSQETSEVANVDENAVYE